MTLHYYFHLSHTRTGRKEDGGLLNPNQSVSWRCWRSQLHFSISQRRSCVHSPDKPEPPAGDDKLERAIESGARFPFNSSLIRSPASNWLSNFSISNQHKTSSPFFFLRPHHITCRLANLLQWERRQQQVKEEKENWESLRHVSVCDLLG